MAVTDSIRSKLSTVPHKPGVYLMKDRFGTVIYVGKARDLRRRVSQYFHPSRRLGWDLKFNALVEAIHDFDIHVVKSEAESLLLEGRLIKEFRPRYNISFRDDKRFLLLKVNLNDPIPRFTLTRLRNDEGARYFGPFASSGALRRTLNLVRQRFNLRGCRALTPAESDYKHCLYAHLKVCTAPCIGNVPLEQYRMQVTAACDFLDGQCAEMSAEVEAAMRKAAAALDFEKAAQLRDLLQDLKRTTQRTGKFERVPYKLPLALDPERDLRELAALLGLEQPPERIEGFDISNISGTFMVASMVAFRNGRPDRAGYRRFRMKDVPGQDDFACMAETIRRRYSRLLRDLRSGPAKPDEDSGEASPQELQQLIREVGEAARRGPVRASQITERPNARLPDLILIDGGKGQLNAAVAELTALGLAGIPIIGLAKEFEEIHRPGERKPLRLSHDTGALKLLQRVRDESHRFANTYNAQLRLKRISESLLDEFPGIGEARKKALLKRFGSIQRMRQATLDELAAVPGFGGRAAAELKAFLAARTARVGDREG
ncbi:MAG: excinuclease ABC subunit UvrC [Verrucomicrobiales bacterium]|nr:excinuclease ABC subunit UvrC [Verrucomicrobiales bacterium]MCP5525548.1 excinuclease ABC subunit UvrC [Verrucomicrobiales bacterium]